MLKKILSLMLVGVMILSLTACGGNSTSTSSNKKQTKSALKGDFIFYTKNDNGGTYFTNNDDIEETLLSDKNISDICIDEKRKSIIYISDSKLYIKSLKQIDDMPIEIVQYCNFYYHGAIFKHIWNNQILYYEDNNSLYTYDLDSQKKERLTENLKSVSGIFQDNLIYVEGNDKINKIVSYNLRNKNIKEKDISLLNLGYYEFAGEVLYSYGYGDDDSTLKLYKITVEDNPILIDEMETKKLPKKRFNASELHYNNFITFTNGMIYYAKPTNYAIDEITNDRIMSDYIYYFYDGTTLREFDKDAHISRNSEVLNFDFLAAAEYKDNMTQGSFYNDFIVNGEIYRNKKLVGISDDGKLIAFMDRENDSFKTLNILKNEIILENSNQIWRYPIKFTEDKLLYVATNDDLILNNNIIDYNINPHDIERTIRCNSDCSTIIYITNDDTLNIYKDGNTKFIGSADDMYLTNNNNVYYHKDGNAYFYKNDESNLISENAYLVGYSILK